MLAGFVEFNTFSMLAGYSSKMENMLSQLNVRTESEEIRQFLYCYHDNRPRKTTEVRYPESIVNLGVPLFLDHTTVYDYSGFKLVLCRNSLKALKIEWSKE